MAGEAAEALAGRSMSAAKGRLKSWLDTLSDGDRRAVEDAVATHPDPPNRGGPTPPFPFPSRTLPAILRAPVAMEAKTPANAMNNDAKQPETTRLRWIFWLCLFVAAWWWYGRSPLPSDEER